MFELVVVWWGLGGKNKTNEKEEGKKRQKDRKMVKDGEVLRKRWGWDGGGATPK